MGVLRNGAAADVVLQLCWAARNCRLAFARFELGATLRRKNVLALQVFGGVNVAGLPRLVLLARAFLTRGFGNAGVLVRPLALVVLAWLRLPLRAAGPSACKCQRKNQHNGDTTTDRAGRGPCGAQVADPGWGVKIRTCHSKPNRRRGTALFEIVYLKPPPLEHNNFSRGFPAKDRREAR